MTHHCCWPATLDLTVFGEKTQKDIILTPLYLAKTTIFICDEWIYASFTQKKGK
jgi:hypothetical protein